jgi:dimethylargininase
MSEAGIAQSYGGQSMTAPLRRVLVHPPGESFLTADPRVWNYTGPPDPERARAEHAHLVEILRAEGAEVHIHGGDNGPSADSVFVFDPILMTDRGFVTLRMGKAPRRGEESGLSARLESLGIPRIGAVGGVGTVEGGDLLWLDRDTLAAGRGFRTNSEGIAQLGSILADGGVRIRTYDLPVHRGARACLHLLSLISFVTSETALVFEPLMPVALWLELRDRGIRTVSVPPEEFETLGTNVLCLRPGRCLALGDNPRTRRLLEAEGVEVLTYPGREISLKAEGGPTCLTLPLLRKE